MLHRFLLDHIKFSNRDMNKVKGEASSNQTYNIGIKKSRRKVNIDQKA